MSVPAAAVAGPVLVIDRSEERRVGEVGGAGLLAALVCSAGLLAVTVAEFVSTVPLAVFGGTRAPILKLTLAPLASVPTVHVTTFGAVWLHPHAAPAIRVPDVTGVETGALPDVEGPLLVTVSV